MVNKKIILSIIIVLLILLEIAISGYLIYKDSTKQDNGICFVGTSCESVQDSQYGQIFGIKLPYYSIVLFTILLILFFFYKKTFYLASLIGGAVSIYLIYIQLFVLKQFCSICTTVDSIMLLILILSIVGMFLKKKEKVENTVTNNNNNVVTSSNQKVL